MSGWGAAQWLQDQEEEAVAVEVFTPPPKITKETQPPLAVTLWRCSSCGKWSHAKRRPKGHYRFVPWISRERLTDGAIRSSRFGREGWEVPCGPFEKWEAWKVERP